MSIGEVLARLRDDFPGHDDLQAPVPGGRGPGRAAADVGRLPQVLDWIDVERLGYVLAAQRDRFLPLRVIRDQLAALDRGEPVADADYRLSGSPPPHRAIARVRR